MGTGIGSTDGIEAAPFGVRHPLPHPLSLSFGVNSGAGLIAIDPPGSVQ